MPKVVLSESKGDSVRDTLVQLNLTPLPTRYRPL